MYNLNIKNILNFFLMFALILCFQGFIQTSNEKIKNEALIYGNNTMQINGKFLYFKELRENPKLSQNLNPLKLVDTQSSSNKKDLSEIDTYHRFKGNLKISGILQYSIGMDWSGFYKEWILFFDEPYYKLKLIPKNIPYANAKEENMPDSAYMKITQNDNQWLQNVFDLAKSKPLAFVGIRVNGILKELDISTSEGDEWNFSGKIEQLKPAGKVIIKYPNKSELDTIVGSEIYLSYTSKDSYINLRQTPNGKILTQIQKSDMPKPCEFKEDKGLIFYLEQDPTNSGWLKVAYIPPQAKDTSKAIYGVIHESQVGFECGE